MLITINGVEFRRIVGDKVNKGIEEERIMNYIRRLYSKKEINKLKKLVPWLWGVSGSVMAGNVVFAEEGNTTESLWTSMMPVFKVFQDISMVLGAIALFSGLIIMMFKKTEGRKFVMTSAMVIAGCFVVPAVIMLIAIVGGIINDTLIDVFRSSDLRNSVEIGG